MLQVGALVFTGNLHVRMCGLVGPAACLPIVLEDLFLRRRLGGQVALSVLVWQWFL